jgi:hypothetical protein
VVKEGLDPLAQFIGEFSQSGILAHQFNQRRGLLGGQGLSLSAGLGEILAMGGIGFGMGLVAIRLTGLGWPGRS